MSKYRRKTVDKDDLWGSIIKLCSDYLIAHGPGEKHSNVVLFSHELLYGLGVISKNEFFSRTESL